MIFLQLPPWTTGIWFTSTMHAFKVSLLDVQVKVSTFPPFEQWWLLKKKVFLENYSNYLNTGLFRYSNGPNKSGFWFVWILNVVQNPDWSVRISDRNMAIWIPNPVTIQMLDTVFCGYFVCKIELTFVELLLRILVKVRWVLGRANTALISVLNYVQLVKEVM